MCGIAGSVNSILTHKDIDLIHHRGPDSQALVHFQLGEANVYLGHTRLSILDLSPAGNQPMTSQCGNYCIVFNGEIYNHKDLRRKISGITFKGSSDTETILYYLIQFGIDAVKDFNGIFAFALLDKTKGRIYLVRDIFGVKPLYYTIVGNKLIFGSEIKVILNNKAYEKELDRNSLNTFLTFRYNPSPETLFQGIKKLDPATYLQFSLTGEFLLTCYYPKEQKINTTIQEPEAIDEYKHLLGQAVERQLLSDVPIGLFLSGGLDSAVLGHLMASKAQYKIDTFTVGFQGEGNYNELKDAAETAAFIGSSHHEIYMEKNDYMNYFHQSFFHTEEPIAEPTIPALFYVSKLASQYVKVVLSGQGADEPMAGYKRYRGEKFLADYQKLLSLLPLSLAEKFFPRNYAIARGVYAARFRNELERFIAIYTLFTPALKKNLFAADMQELIQQDQKFLFEKYYYRTDSNADSLSKLLFLDTRTMLPDNLLLFNDKMTMACSLENRVPFLDIDLVNFIETLPGHLKLNQGLGKYIHRKAAEQWLPSSIINRKKRGFETPVEEWFKQELSNTLIDLVDSSDSFSRKYFQTDFIKKMITLHKQQKKNFKHQLFIILSLELWYKNFYSVNLNHIK
jgi:asparagine synthase (glutamine-hydrolysing)